jgi:hypothetical protein
MLFPAPDRVMVPMATLVALPVLNLALSQFVSIRPSASPSHGPTSPSLMPGITPSTSPSALTSAVPSAAPSASLAPCRGGQPSIAPSASLSAGRVLSQFVSLARVCNRAPLRLCSGITARVLFLAPVLVLNRVPNRVLSQCWT